MATVIDSLVLELGIDPAKFTKGQKEALDQLRKFQEQATRGGKDIEAQQLRVSENLSSLKRAALGTAAVFLGGMGIKEFTSYITRLDAATARSARTLDVSARELSDWQGAAEQAGGSASSMTGAMQGMSGAMQQLVLTGNAGFVPLFNRLGINLRQANGQLKTSSQLFLDLAKAVEGMNPARAKALLSMVPGMNEETINLLIRGRGAVEAYLAAAHAAGGTTRESAAAAEEYQRQLANLERSASSAGRTIVGFFLPALTAAATGVENLLNKMRTGELQGGMNKTLNIPENHGWGYFLSKLLIGPKFAAAHYDDPMAAARASLAAGLTARAAGLAGASGLPVKPGAGAGSPFTSSVSSAISGVPGLERVTSMNDAFHQALGGQHPLGQAMDVTVKDPSKSAETAGAIRAALAAAGINASVIDEYANPSARATGGHIHIGARGAALRGGVPGAGAAAAASTINNRGGDTTTSSTHIGTIVIHAEGGNSGEIAGGIGPAVRRAAPFNGGLQ